MVPFYNREEFIGQLIDTIAGQDYRALEVVAVDDGSTDGSARVFEASKGRLSCPVNLITQSNAGPYAARNNARGVAQGSMLAFQDSDDEWPADHISRLVTLLNDNQDVDWVFGSIQRIAHASRRVVQETNYRNDEGELHPIFSLKSERRANGLQVLRDDQLCNVAISHGIPGSMQCALIRRRVFDELHFDPSYMTGYDRFLTIHAVMRGYRFGYVHETHQIYHVHENNISLVAGGDAVKREASARTLSRGYEEILHSSVTERQRRLARKRLAKELAWGLSVSLREQLKFVQAFRALARAVANDPCEWRYWKSFVAAVLRAVVQRTLKS